MQKRLLVDKIWKPYIELTKISNNGFKTNYVPVKGIDSNVLSIVAEKLTRYKERFESILKRPESEQVADIPPAVEDLDICIDPPTKEEVKSAIKAMKRGKACGADGVTAEMLKAEDTETRRHLPCILREIWESETIPETNCPERVILVIATTGEALLCSP